jgi:branched-chain amino acid transport system permease protein
MTYEAASRRVPPPIATGIILVAVVVLSSGPLWLGRANLWLVAEILQVFTMAQMWNLVAGYGGLLSFGHQAFIGIGAYSLFLISNHLGISPFLIVPISFLISGGAAGVLAPFLFRLRDAYFSIAIWVVAELLRLAVTQSKFLGSVYGLPLQFARSANHVWFAYDFYWWSTALAGGSILLVLALLRTHVGLSLLAVRDNELAASSLGVDVWRSRFVAFLLSGAGCGAAGAVYYCANFHVEPGAAFDVNWAVVMLFIVIIGGIGTIEGPIIGTAIYFTLRALFGDSGAWYLIVMGTAAVITMVFARKGIWGTFSAWRGIEMFSIRRLPEDRLVPALDKVVDHG